MSRTFILGLILLFAAGVARSEDTAPKGDKVLSGMAIVGNDDAPKSLVIVPWKSAGLGDSLDVWSDLGDERQPVDRDVFMRELDYYQIRAASSAAAKR